MSPPSSAISPFIKHMHHFRRWLWNVPEGKRTILDALLWWESRRLVYNFFVGAVALPSLLLFFLAVSATGELEPGEDAVEPLALLFAPFAINFCYCAGWIGESILRLLFPNKERTLGPLLFKIGLGFSLFVVTLPALFWSIYRLLQLVGIIN